MGMRLVAACKRAGMSGLLGGLLSGVLGDMMHG